MILIGSRALSYWHHEHKERENSDWDVICHPGVASCILGSINQNNYSWKWENIELHNSLFLNNKDIYRYTTNSNLQIQDIRINVCSSRGLAAIKRGHLHRPLNFAKHMIQYQFLDRKFDQDDLAFIAERSRLTKQVFGDVEGFDNKSNNEFFQDAVNRIFEHDEIHEAINCLLYKRIKKDPNKATYDIDLWNTLTLEEQDQYVREECYVIAIERFLVPHRGRFPYKIAYIKALEKCCTTLDTGPFREHSIDRWSIIKQFDSTVFDRFFGTATWRNYANS